MAKKFLIFLVVLILSSCNYSSNERSKEIINNDTVSKIIVKKLKGVQVDTNSFKQIAGNFKDSVDSEKLIITRQNVFGSSAEGGQIVVYKNVNNDTLKLKAFYYGETGKSEYDFYLKNKKPLLFSEKLTYYKSPIGQSKVKIDSVSINNFIIQDWTILVGENNGKAKTSSYESEQKATEIKDLYFEVLSQMEK